MLALLAFFACLLAFLVYPMLASAACHYWRTQATATRCWQLCAGKGYCRKCDGRVNKSVCGSISRLPQLTSQAPESQRVFCAAVLEFACRRSIPSSQTHGIDAACVTVCGVHFATLRPNCTQLSRSAKVRRQLTSSRCGTPCPSFWWTSRTRRSSRWMPACTASCNCPLMRLRQRFGLTETTARST
mgnify:CR=1 FL=1